MKQILYINAFTTHQSVKRSIKELIPNSGMRRRMSAIVKQGVTVGMDCLCDFSDSKEVDAIITSTYLGCIEDTEKFIEIIESTEESLLNPTPFIRSTFNTIGAQIALLCQNKHYNMTYSHGKKSWEQAFLDAALLIAEKDADNVLVGYYDEQTALEDQLCERLSLSIKDLFTSGSFFCVVSSKPSINCLVELEWEMIDKKSDSLILATDFMRSILDVSNQPVLLNGEIQRIKVKSCL
ncbi:beta-ketoacyl synthase chain length factor [Gammaproteobacteria bacterium]|nr:beta-ketoacyl synthase chain length factor [Gammaproteobacteria bacterium]